MITKNEIKFVRSLASKKERDTASLFVAEGEKLVSELCSTMSVEQIYRVGENCAAADMERMSMLKTPTSTLALIKIPTASTKIEGRVLVLDAVQDPGNLGTIIRTADWFGVHRVVCSADTADVYAPKVVQATMGAIARVEVVYTDLPQWLEARDGRKVYGTFLERSTPLGDVSFADDAIIIMGNEGRGISDEVASYVTDRVFIERAAGGAGESLNVAIATAIILSHL